MRSFEIKFYSDRDGQPRASFVLPSGRRLSSQCPIRVDVVDNLGPVLGGLLAFASESREQAEEAMREILQERYVPEEDE